MASEPGIHLSEEEMRIVQVAMLKLNEEVFSLQEWKITEGLRLRISEYFRVKEENAKPFMTRMWRKISPWAK